MVTDKEFTHLQQAMQDYRNKRADIRKNSPTQQLNISKLEKDMIEKGRKLGAASLKERIAAL